MSSLNELHAFLETGKNLKDPDRRNPNIQVFVRSTDSDTTAQTRLKWESHAVAASTHSHPVAFRFQEEKTKHYRSEMTIYNNSEHSELSYNTLL